MIRCLKKSDDVNDEEFRTVGSGNNELLLLQGVEKEVYFGSEVFHHFSQESDVLDETDDFLEEEWSARKA